VSQAPLPDQSWVKNLPLERVPATLVAVAALQSALAARLLEHPDSSNSTPSELIDAPALAARLGVHESYVRTAARAGKIPRVRVGRYVRFRAADVERALAEAKS
jgi:excisionase family DNA binding protein